MGQAYYSALVNPIKSELTDAFFTVGYTSLASDTLGEKSGGRLAVRMAEVVGGAVAAFEADTTGGDSTTVCPPEGCFWSPESRRYYVRDHLGSVRAVVDGSGYVVEAKDYYAWGLEMPGRVFVLGAETSVSSIPTGWLLVIHHCNVCETFRAGRLPSLQEQGRL